MTEAEWTASAEPWTMLDVLRDVITERKVRLFATACCRLLRRHGIDLHNLRIIEISELFADGITPVTALQNAHAEILSAHQELQYDRSNPIASGSTEAALGLRPNLNLGYVASGTLIVARAIATRGKWSGMRIPAGPLPEPSMDDLTLARRGEVAELSAQATLIRDIFGNPYRPVSFSPEWRTDTAIALASQMYDSREFGAMPILADALQDAGCDNDDILSHCRGEGPHVRGCWVVDLVLGKE